LSLFLPFSTFHFDKKIWRVENGSPNTARQFPCGALTKKKQIQNIYILHVIAGKKWSTKKDMSYWHQKKESKKNKQ
jgi:hypothetical protein